MRDLHAELETWDGNHAAAWTPGPGDILIGTVKSYSTDRNQYGPVRVVTIQDEETGELASVWISSTVLLSLFKEQKPRVGERIGLKYTGKHPEKNCELYALIVDREEADTDFEPLGGEVASGSPDQDGDPAPSADMLAAGESVEITAEERAFFAENLGADPAATTPGNGGGDGTASGLEAVLRDTIRRQEEQIQRQGCSLDRLERMLHSALSALNRGDTAADEAERPVRVVSSGRGTPGTEPLVAAAPRDRRWALRLWILAAAVVASGALGAAARLLHWLH